MKHWPLVHSDHLDLEAFSLDDGGSFIEVVEPGVAYACLLTEGRLVATRAGGEPLDISPRRPVIFGGPGTYTFTATGPCAGMRGILHPLVRKPFAWPPRAVAEAIDLVGLFFGLVAARSARSSARRRPRRGSDPPT